jgi:flagellin
LSLTLGNNIASLKVQNALSRTGAEQQTLMKRLSSGLRINDAGDDAAGLALSTLLNRDAKLAAVAGRNANDGISALNVVDQSLAGIQNVLFRISELAAQGATGTYSMQQRSIIDLEVQALASEIQRIATVTSFNGINLLSNSSSITLQIGIDGSANSRLIVGAVSGTLESLELASIGSSQFNHTVLGTTTEEAQNHSRTLMAAAKAAIEDVSSRRGEIGAATSRLESAVSTLASSRENFISAASNITDANVAEDAANLLRTKILQSAQVSLLAQANQQAQRVLELLQ